jgi:hypothetical protein
MMRVIIFFFQLIFKHYLETLAHNVICTVEIYDNIRNQILFLRAILDIHTIDRSCHKLYVRLAKILPLLHRLQEFRFRLVHN